MTDVEVIKKYFADKHLTWHLVTKSYESIPEIRDAADNILKATPEYETPIKAIMSLCRGISLRKCLTCGKLISYTKSVKNKQDYCSIACSKKSSIVKQKRASTCLNKYGYAFPLKNESCKEKYKNTCIERYGCDNVSKSDSVKSKKVETIIHRYGVENVFQSNEVKEKIKHKNIERYGVENPSLNLEIKNKIINKIKATNQEKYGVDFPFLKKEIREKSVKSCQKKYGNETYSGSRANLDKTYKFLVDKYKEYVSPEFTEDEYIGWTGDNYGKKYKWRCVKCGNIFESHIHSTFLNAPRCLKCFPILSGTSRMEEEIYDFMKSLYGGSIERNVRNVISPYELDVYIPDIKLAIEFNGVFWHNEENVGSDYHLMKLELCEKQNIRLIHIFEDEWNNKKDIVKDRIKSILGIYEVKIFARKCHIKEVDNKTASDFLDANHLQGRDNSSLRYGLFYKDELVSLITFSKPRFTTKYDYELVRFASKKGFQIIGGCGKLLKFFEKNNKNKTLISYADRRYSNGKLYFSLGFHLIGKSAPNYWWVKNDIKLSRYQCQKHKLDKLLGSNFNSENSEAENMKNNNYNKIFDCGNLVFVKTME